MTSHSSDDVLGVLQTLGIDAQTRDHAPVLTVEAMMAAHGDLPGAQTKNLFLRDAKKAYFLVSMLHNATLDMKALRPLIGARGNLSFASTEALMDKLGVISGAVSPLAIINDAEDAVTVCLQNELMSHDIVNVHPLTSERTTALRPADLLRFLEARKHPPTLFSLTT